MTEDLKVRIEVLEKWTHDMDIKQASLESDRKHLDKEFQDIKNQVREGFKEIKGHLSKLVWLIISSIVLAFMSWFLGLGVTAGV